MMTRKALARQEESQLQLVLQELKASKELIKQLNREREDIEKELLDVLERNNSLKKELSKLHSELLVNSDERDRLQSIIDGFDQCRDEYEQALIQIAALEKQLYEANNLIYQLETNKSQVIASQNQSLFEELVCSGPSLVSASCPVNTLETVDSTKKDYTNKQFARNTAVCSRNKLKKYIKINKYINKTKKLIYQNKKFFKYTHCVRERMHLVEKLDTCASIIEENRLIYEKNISGLNNKIFKLRESLRVMTQNYESSKNEIREYILALQCMSHVSAINETVILKRHSLASGLGDSELLTNKPVCDPIVSKSCQTLVLTNNNNSFVQNNSVKNVMFSDAFGKNFGQLLNTYSEQSFVNNCYPGLLLIDIFEKILNCKLDTNTNLIILVFNRGKVNRRILLNYYNKLSLLHLKSIVMFTLPYSESLPQEENNIRYNINLAMDTMSLYSDKHLEIIDINKLFHKFYLTKDKYYLSNYYKRQIAITLSYFIDNLAKNLASSTAPIEQ